MRAAWIFTYNLIDRLIPNGLSLYTLGAGLLAASLALAPMVFGSPNHLLMPALMLAGLANIAPAAVAMMNALRRSSALASRMRGDRPPIAAVRLFHVAVAAHAALVLALLLPALQTVLERDGGALIWIALPLIWTPLAGAAMILALLNRLRWDARFAALGAVVSIAAFGCAVGYAPAIYGWDLRPLGWYAILVTAIPSLAFLTVFLRRAPIFSASRWRRRGLAAALFIALACALGFQMASNPNNEFSESLRTALNGRPSEIRFSDLTGFEWDAVEIYGAYTYQKQISPAAREGADIISLSHFWIYERLKFAAFLRDGEVVYYEAFWTDGYSLHFPPGSRNPIVLKPEDAVFIAEYDSGGYPRLTLESPAAFPTPIE